MPAAAPQAQPSQHPTATPQPPQSPAQPQLPPGTLLITEELLRSFATELTLSVVQVFSNISGRYDRQAQTRDCCRHRGRKGHLSAREEGAYSPPGPVNPAISSRQRKREGDRGEERGGGNERPAQGTGLPSTLSHANTTGSGRVPLCQWNCQGLRGSVSVSLLTNN